MRASAEFCRVYGRAPSPLRTIEDPDNNLVWLKLGIGCIGCDELEPYTRRRLLEILASIPDGQVSNEQEEARLFEQMKAAGVDQPP